MTTIELLEELSVEIRTSQAVATARAEDRAGVELVGAFGDPYQCGARDAYRDCANVLDLIIDTLKQEGVRA